MTEKAKIMIIIAKKYLKNGNNLEAENILNQLKDTNIKSSDVLLELGKLFAVLNKREDALAIFKKGMDLYSKDPYFRLESARTIAKTSWSELKEDWPDGKPGYSEAEADWIKEMNKAIGYLNYIIKSMDTDNEHARYEIARIHKELGSSNIAENKKLESFETAERRLLQIFDIAKRKAEESKNSNVAHVPYAGLALTELYASDEAGKYLDIDKNIQEINKRILAFINIKDFKNSKNVEEYMQNQQDDDFTFNLRGKFFKGLNITARIEEALSNGAFEKISHQNLAYDVWVINIPNSGIKGNTNLHYATALVLKGTSKPIAIFPSDNILNHNIETMIDIDKEHSRDAV